MMRISTLTHLTIGLVAMTLGVLCLGHTIGLMPDAMAERARQRTQLCELLTLGFAYGAQSGDFHEVAAITYGAIERKSGLLSVGLRDLSSQIIFATDAHQSLWTSAAEDTARGTHLRVAVLRDGAPWATAEFRFEPLSVGALGAFLGSPLLKLVSFTAICCFAMYRLYLRRMLTFLDPSRVIPRHVKAAFDTLSEGVAVLDPSQRVVLANSALCATIQAKEAELEGRPLASLPWREADGERSSTELPWSAVARAGTPLRGQPMRLQRDGGDVAFMVNATAIQDEKKRIRGVLATFDNVTSIEHKNRELSDLVRRLEESREKIRRQNDELQLLATRDPLTGCFNRRAFMERLDAEWRRAARSAASLSCVMVDIDRFKLINDNHGHASGDLVLQSVAQTLQQAVRACDVVCRFGGEEFCILLPDTSLAGAADLSERLRSQIAAMPIARLNVTASLGASSTELEIDSQETLIEWADRALYAAKHGGRNRVVRADQVAETPKRESTSVPPNVSQDHFPLPALNGLMAALSQRDPATAAHSRRVAELSLMLGHSLFDAHESFVLEVAALLHDIGKIGVPDAILLKPGRLTPDERAQMDQHERIGIEIINSAFRSPELTNIVHAHHAFFGGNPNNPGLPSGVDIPLRARILTIADAYDAMVSDRPYRKAMSMDAAVAELRRCAGDQFDPWLVERFVEQIAMRGGGEFIHALAQPLEAAFGLGVQAERIAAILETGDVEQLKIVSQRLAAIGAKCGLPRISASAADLYRELTSALDLRSLRQLKQLLDTCREVQDELLSADTPRPSTFASPARLPQLDSGKA